MSGRDPDDPRYPYDYTEWWMCDNCAAQWYVPEDFEERQEECPFCGHDQHTLRDRHPEEEQ